MVPGEVEASDRRWLGQRDGGDHGLGGPLPGDVEASDEVARVHYCC
jgi:hypothetical protein